MPTVGKDTPQLHHLHHVRASTVHVLQRRIADGVIAVMGVNHPHFTTQKSFQAKSTTPFTAANSSPKRPARYASVWKRSLESELSYLKKSVPR